MIGCSGDAMEEIVGISVVRASDSSVELRRFRELFSCGLGSLDICSTKNTSESVESIEMFDAMLELIDEVE